MPSCRRTLPALYLRSAHSLPAYISYTTDEMGSYAADSQFRPGVPSFSAWRQLIRLKTLTHLASVQYDSLVRTAGYQAADFLSLTQWGLKSFRFKCSLRLVDFLLPDVLMRGFCAAITLVLRHSILARDSHLHCRSLMRCRLHMIHTWTSKERWLSFY